MSTAVRPETWLQFARQEYLETFIREGGAAIKFPIPLDEQARDSVLSAVAGAATELDYFIAHVSAAETKVHMIDQIFFRVAEQVEWEELSERVLVRLCETEGYQPPDRTAAPFLQRIAEKNGIDQNVVQMELKRKLGTSVFKQHALAKDFRVAMTNLCLAQLTGGTDSEITIKAIKDWLTGRNKAVSAVKPYQIFNRISRSNARHFLESLLHWVTFAGYPGTVILLDITRVSLSRNPHDEYLHYTTSALLDAYELLRQFIDATDRLTNCLFVVVPDMSFLDEDPIGRGIGRYEALKFRVFDEIRARQHVNPMASLVRLSSSAEQ